MGPTNWCRRGPEGEVKKNKQAVRLTAQPRGAREGGTTRPAQGAPPPSSLLNGLAFCLPRPTRARASEFPCLRGHVPRAGPSGREAPPVLTPCPQLDVNDKRTLLNMPGCFAPLCRCTDAPPPYARGKPTRWKAGGPVLTRSRPSSSTTCLSLCPATSALL